MQKNEGSKKYCIDEYCGVKEEYAVGVTLGLKSEILLQFPYMNLMFEYPENLDYVEVNYGDIILAEYYTFVMEYKGTAFRLLNRIFGIKNLMYYDSDKEKQYQKLINTIYNEFSLVETKAILYKMLDFIRENLKSKICYTY